MDKLVVDGVSKLDKILFEVMHEFYLFPCTTKYYTRKICIFFGFSVHIFLHF